jgi:maltooligosyltrehalose trehalohydrolase
LTHGPSLGALVAGGATRFRVWAPAADRVEVLVEGGGVHPMTPSAGGYHEVVVPGVGPGARYRLRVDGRGPFPDPASRAQPEGVHGPSMVVDPAAFAWTDAAWPGVALRDLVIYELHVGTFSPAGTFAGTAARLPALRELGVTAIELMPLADFPGRRSWGYDGVSPFAPARCYGTPDDLRRMVDAAHQLGMGVIVDVVYNHLGPDGNHLAAFSPYYFTHRHQTPWGDAMNCDGEGSEGVRDFLAENALHWIREYHADGLRLDATHAIVDDSPRHVLTELATRVRDEADRPALVIAEDARNLAALIRPPSDGGMGLDAVWSDDFHHQVRARLAGDRDGYFADFTGAVEPLAETLRRGWLFTGQVSRSHGAPRGTDPAGLPRERFVFCVQNHDQVGNRAFGDRLHHGIDAAAWRAAVALLLLSPETPLLFQGQEWAASTPFLYFTDHEPALGRLVTEGRRREFGRFTAFADPATRARIPDPQADETFEASRLRWEERSREPHASSLRLHRALLALRRSALIARFDRFDAVAVPPAGLLLRIGELAAAVWLEGRGEIEVSGVGARVLLSTEDPAFASEPAPVGVVRSEGATRLRFGRPGALVLS